MNIALFGGTFDPIHCGHLSAARAARDRFALDRVHFVPAGRPPHRHRERLTAYEHRYAMVALACAGEPGFCASLAESPAHRGASYSIRTVRRFRRQLAATDRLFFLAGADAFLELRSWREWRPLLGLVNFLVISRPGFPLHKVAQVIPPDLLRAGGAGQGGPALPARTGAPDSGTPGATGSDFEVREFPLRRSCAWVLTGVWEPVSATEVRRRAREGKSLAGLVPPGVADYIAKQQLYAG